MNKEIKRYLGSTFVLSWILWGTIIILNQFDLLLYGKPLTMVFFIPAALAPALCQIFLKWKYSNKEDYMSFLKSIVNPKHHIGWYLIVIGSAFIYFFLPVLFGAGTIERPLYIALLEFPIMIIGGGLEEIGWRGFLQPELEKKLPIIPSTFIVGTIWAVWHAPLWFIAGTHQESNLDFLWFLINAIALSFLLAAIYRRTKSIFLCILFHAFTNAFWDVILPSYEYMPIIIMLAVSFISFLIIIKTNNHQKQNI
jgi:membrane protease YdiL (CAAX protease family)